MTMKDARVTNQKPYRPNVGIALFNADGRVLIGHRFKGDGPEIILPGLDWQMPQGGVDEGENLRDAALRELWEETSVKSADYLGETDWLTITSSRPTTGRRRIGWRSSAGSARNGSRCASPAAMTRSIR
ncbi:8-oxo-dGTP pyrophosphatase MutT (NUDIX family) [Bradyrhizobium sp. i1.7.7]